MLFMNEYDIDHAQRRAVHPVTVRAARLLAAWRDIVNANSDGWAHWRAGASSARQLMEFVKNNGTDPRALNKAMGPIHRLCTKHKLPRPLEGGA